MKLTQEQRVEKMAEALFDSTNSSFKWADTHERQQDWWRKLAAYVVDEQDRREGPMDQFIRNQPCRCHEHTEYKCDRCKVLAWHAALDAAPEPTLLEAVEAHVVLMERGHWTDPSTGAIAGSVLAVKAAAERERRKA